MGLFLLRSGYLLKEIIYVIDSIHLVCQDYFENGIYKCYYPHQ